jgi:hypothetical protein
MVPAEGKAPPMMEGPYTKWFHGSPLRLEAVAPGSTVTPVRELACVFAHKPSYVSIEVRERDGEREVAIDHDGARPGYLYRVVVSDPPTDLKQHPTSGFAPGEEMLTTRPLPLELICELPVPNVAEGDL